MTRIKLEELREKARQILTSGKWLSSITEGERSVCVYSDGLHCSSWNRFDPEFTTTDIEEAINYLYVEP